MSYTTWDIETQTNGLFKRKASPFYQTARTVTHGWKKKDGKPSEQRFGTWPTAGWLKPILAGTRLLIGMNIKFDLLHALQDSDNLSAWMKWVVDGGVIWDIQLAEYLLSGMEPSSHMLSLDEIAPRYGGNLKVDEVKALWAAGVNTDEIEPDLLTRYLIGGPDEVGVFQMGDIENTEIVALKQIARARETKQLNSILLNMGALMFTVEAERNGMFVDKELGLKIAAELEVKLGELRIALDAYLPVLPEDFEWKWTSRKKLSALIFGGTIKYETDHYVHADGTSTAKHLWRPGMESLGDAKELTYYLKTTKVDTGEVFKSGKNKGEKKYRNETGPDIERGPKTRKGDAFFTFPRMTEPSKAWETAEPGVYSVAEEILTALGNRDIPFLKTLSTLAKLTKDMGTYYITTDPEDETKQKGMLTLVGPDGIIHHMLNMVNTVTARLSSSNPNLQNLPTIDEEDAEQSIVKTIFKSRFGPTGKIIQSDFKSLEVYVQAILTLSKQLIADLKAGLDMHVLRLSQKEHMPYEDVLKLAKGYKLPDGTKVDAEKAWAVKRTNSKTFSFKAAYGAGDKSMSEDSGIPIEEIAALRAADEARYPEVNAFYDRQHKAILANSRPTSTFVPHPDKPSVMVQLEKSSIRTPDGKLYTFRNNPSPEYLLKRGILSSYSPTEEKNYPIQGTGGEWAKAAMYLSLVEFYRRNNWGGLGLLVNQVHDAIYSDADASVATEAAAVLHAAMEAASEYMEYLFGWPIPIPVPSDTEWGASMADHTEVPGLKEQAALVRQSIRQLHMKGYTPTFELQGNE